MATHAEGAPRRLKRIKPPADTDAVPKDETKTYEFYKRIIHTSILRLKNEREKLNYSSWLTRLDREQPNQSRKFLVVALFVSLKSHRPFYIFAETPPDDLSELNTITYDNMMEFVKKLQQTTNSLFADEDVPVQDRAERLAAVATDMCSYSATKTSQYMAQSFYARSDFPINTWHNEKSILLPNNLDHNEWELYLNRLYTAKKSQDTGGPKSQHSCEIMKIDQVTKNISFTFRWHPMSVLYNNDTRPQKTACFLDVDQDVLNQPFNQRQIDEAAMAIVHGKSFPGYKVLNPRCYSTALMPDPKFVYNMTGVKIIYNNKPLFLVDERAERTPKQRQCSSGGGSAGETAAKPTGHRRPPGSPDGGQRPRTSPCAKYAVKACPAKAEAASTRRGRKYGCCGGSVYDAEPAAAAEPTPVGGGRCRYGASVDRQVDLNNNERPAARNGRRKTSGSPARSPSDNASDGGRSAPPSGRKRAACRDADSRYDDFSPVGPLCKMKRRDQQPRRAVRNSSDASEENGAVDRRRSAAEQQSRRGKDCGAVGTAKNGASGPRRRSVSVPGGGAGTRVRADRTGGRNGNGWSSRGSDANEQSLSVPRFSEHWDPDVNDYFEFASGRDGEQGGFLVSERKTGPRANGQTGDGSADDRSCGSGWSVEVAVPPGSDHYCDSLESLSTLSSDSGGVREEDRCSDRGCSNRPASAANGWHAGKSSPDENNNNASSGRVPRSFNVGHRGGSVADDWSRAGQPRNPEDGRAADVCSDDWTDGDSAGYEEHGNNESDLRRLPSFHDYPHIKDTSMPDCSYESSDDGASAEECPHGADV